MKLPSKIITFINHLKLIQDQPAILGDSLYGPFLCLLICSAVNLLSLILQGPELFTAQGAFPAIYSLTLRGENLISILPTALLNAIPYYWQIPLTATVLIHLGLLGYMAMKPGKWILLTLFLFEYSLLIRSQFLIHGGNIFFVHVLILLIVRGFLPTRFRKIFSAIWVIQFLLIYLTSGLNKDVELWLISGEALNKFMELEAQNIGNVFNSLGIIGEILSRLVIPIEVLAPLICLLYFLWGKWNKHMIAVLLSLLALIHIGSFFTFHIFTFPFIGLALIWGIFNAFQDSFTLPFKVKISLFLVLFITFLIPMWEAKFKPFEIYPFKNDWKFFRKLPPSKGDILKLSALKGDKIIYENELNTSFHWSRYRYITDVDFPDYEKHRNEMNKYLCGKYQVDKVFWKTSLREDVHPCNR